MLKDDEFAKKNQEYKVYIDFGYKNDKWTPVHGCKELDLALYLGVSLGGVVVFLTIG